MRTHHYVMTVARRGPEYPLDASRRRIALCRGITARSLAGQVGDWTWIVYVHPQDPLLEERLDAFRSAGRPVVPVEDNAGVARVIDWSAAVLTTRIDDDDAFARGAFARLRQSARRLRERTALMFPFGYRVFDGRADQVRHRKNAWVSIFAPLGDPSHVRLTKHHQIRALAPVHMVDNRPGWLWVRHGDTDSGFHRAAGPMTRDIRDQFDVDWGLLTPEAVAA